MRDSTAIPINIPLLCAATGSVVAALALYMWTTAAIPASPANVIAALLTLVILLFTLSYSAFEIIKQVSMARRDQHLAYSIGINALLGSLLAGLVAFILANIGMHGLLFNAIGMAVVILSGASLLLFISYGAPETAQKTQDTLKNTDPPARIVLPALPISHKQVTLLDEEAPTLRRGRPPNPRFRLEDLPPLFQDDMLYRRPHPKMARFYTTTKVSQEPDVLNEDACLISPDETHFALCDGASNSSLPRSWATLLSQQWLKEPLYSRSIDAIDLEYWLKEPRMRWQEWVRQVWWPTVNERNTLTGDHPVRREQIEEIERRGASATLLGLLLDRKNRRWTATTLGDTSLFILNRDGHDLKISHSIPFSSSANFTQTPPLLSSRIDDNLAYPAARMRTHRELYRPGDVLLMATDALAKWLLIQVEQRSSGWRRLLALDSQQSFVHFVEEQRESGLLEEDDTTLVIIQL